MQYSSSIEQSSTAVPLSLSPLSLSPLTHPDGPTGGGRGGGGACRSNHSNSHILRTTYVITLSSFHPQSQPSSSDPPVLPNSDELDEMSINIVCPQSCVCSLQHSSSRAPFVLLRYKHRLLGKQIITGKAVSMRIRNRFSKKSGVLRSLTRLRSNP